MISSSWQHNPYILSNDLLLVLGVRVVPDVLLVGALEVAGLEVGGAGDPASVCFKAKECQDLLEAVLEGLAHVLVVDDQQPLGRVVLQPVRVEVEPSGRLDLDKLLPAGSYKLINLGQASVTSAEKSGHRIRTLDSFQSSFTLTITKRRR